MHLDHRSRVASWIWILALAAGCSSPPPSGPPQIKKLETNVTTLDDGAPLSIVATVTDPNGQSDLLGGTLRTADGKLIGAFSAKSNGLFQIDVGWPAFAEVAPFSFYGSETRTYRVSFTDFGGNEAGQDVALTFRCPDRSGACGSACQRLDVDSACGACGVACAAGEQCNASAAPPTCGPRTIAFDDWGRAFATAYCNAVFTCCDAALLVNAMQNYHFTDPTGCVYIFTDVFLVASMRDSVASGRASYLPEGAGACVVAIERAKCDFSAKPALTCTMFAGAQPTNAACANNRECQTGNGCEIPGGQTMGTCLAYLAVGATCLPHVATCEPTTLFCDTGTSKCVLRKAEGAACTTYQECQTGQVCTASKCTKQVVTCPLF